MLDNDKHNYMLTVLTETVREMQTQARLVNGSISKMETQMAAQGATLIETRHHIEKVVEKIGLVEKQLVALTGIEGNFGQIGDLKEDINTNKKDIAANSNQLSSLFLDRAKLVGYMIGSGGFAGLLSHWLT